MAIQSTTANIKHTLVMFVPETIKFTLVVSPS
jgi:hypothetical protein